MEQEKYKGRTLLCLFHFPHMYQMLLIVAAEVPTSGDYKLNFESLLHQAFHKMLMTQQPPPPPNEHKSHNWTQSLNYMVMHPSNPTAVILHVVIVATTCLEFEFHLHFPCGSLWTELSDFCQSARSRNEQASYVNKH